LQFILLIAGYFLLFHHFTQNSNWQQIRLHLHALSENANWYLLALVCLLMPFNWITETWRWKLILHSLPLKLPYSKYLGGVLTGLSSGTFTPNRIGEMPGRLWAIPQGHRTKALVLTSVYSSLQLIVSLLVGGLSLMWLAPRFSANLHTHGYGWMLAGMGSVLLSVLIFILLYHSQKISFIKKYLPAFILTRISSLEMHEPGTLYKILLITLLRYLIYASQYVLIIIALSPASAAWVLYPAVFVLLLLMSISPSMFLIDMGIRGSLSIFVLSQFGIADVASVLTVSLAWFINIVIPSLPGVYLFVSNPRNNRKKLRIEN